MATTVHDDYLICREYKEQINSKSNDYPGFITFQHENGNHYFAWVNQDEIVLRSEAYPDAEKMERGIKAILKNCDLVERYSTEEEHGAHFLVLWGGGDHQAHTGNREEHSEIGRSCPHSSRAELNALLQFKSVDFANKVVPLNDASANVAAAAVAGTAAVASNLVGDGKAATSAVTENVHAAVSDVSSTGKAAVGAAVAGAAALAGNLTGAAGNAASSVSGKIDDGYEAASSGGGMGWLKWLLPLLLVGAGAYWLSQKGCGDKKDSTVAGADAGTGATGASNTTVAPPKITVDATTGVVNYELGDSMDIELPGGAKLMGVAKNGFENTLINFIKTGTIDTVNKKANWFNLHDVQFVTNKTEYATSKALAQIKNVAATLKAYPNVQIKLGGYTDVAGDSTKNLALSDRRAKQVLKDLIANGAAAGQIVEAVGYGSKHAEAKLGDKEGMARDRKTAAKVAKM